MGPLVGSPLFDTATDQSYGIAPTQRHITSKRSGKEWRCEVVCETCTTKAVTGGGGGKGMQPLSLLEAHHLVDLPLGGGVPSETGTRLPEQRQAPTHPPTQGTCPSLPSLPCSLVPCLRHSIAPTRPPTLAVVRRLSTLMMGHSDPLKYDPACKSGWVRRLLVPDPRTTSAREPFALPHTRPKRSMCCEARAGERERDPVFFL